MNIQQNCFTVLENAAFLSVAESLKPDLYRRIQYPKKLVTFQKSSSGLHGLQLSRNETVKMPIVLEKEEDFIIFDFGEHMVGYVTIRFNSKGSPQDAPIKIEIKLGEMPCEVGGEETKYEGWLSNSWIQDEIRYLDETPVTLQLERRYSFRYMKITLLGLSTKYSLEIAEVYCETVTAANEDDLCNQDIPEDLVQMDQVAIKTLKDCMQDVFEDGPKRDRRLWLGDLRLQALVNYKTFCNYNLVKRCLYLFAGVTNQDGRVSACIFTRPRVIPDDTFLFDYSLLFVPTLYEYYEASKDMDTLKDLWATAKKQIALANDKLIHDIVQDECTWWTFIDWNDELNKQTSAQGVFIYCLTFAIKIAQIVEPTMEEELRQLQASMRKAAIQFWDNKEKAYTSGKQKQISCASQVWMILAGVAKEKQADALLLRLLDHTIPIEMNSPYMYHYYIEALLLLDKTKEALLEMKQFWGGMLADGADTFWEIYKPSDKDFSPYGSVLTLSYCHAWSCTPAYWIRKLEEIKRF